MPEPLLPVMRPIIPKLPHEPHSHTTEEREPDFAAQSPSVFRAPAAPTPQGTGLPVPRPDVSLRQQAQRAIVNTLHQTGSAPLGPADPVVDLPCSTNGQAGPRPEPLKQKRPDPLVPLANIVVQPGPRPQETNATEPKEKPGSPVPEQQRSESRLPSCPKQEPAKVLASFPEASRSQPQAPEVPEDVLVPEPAKRTERQTDPLPKPAAICEERHQPLPQPPSILLAPQSPHESLQPQDSAAPLTHLEPLATNSFQRTALPSQAPPPDSTVPQPQATPGPPIRPHLDLPAALPVSKPDSAPRRTSALTTSDMQRTALPSQTPQPDSTGPQPQIAPVPPIRPHLDLPAALSVPKPDSAPRRTSALKTSAMQRTARSSQTAPPENTVRQPQTAPVPLLPRHLDLPATLPVSKPDSAPRQMAAPKTSDIASPENVQQPRTIQPKPPLSVAHASAPALPTRDISIPSSDTTAATDDFAPSPNPTDAPRNTAPAETAFAARLTPVVEQEAANPASLSSPVVRGSARPLEPPPVPPRPAPETAVIDVEPKTKQQPDAHQRKEQPEPSAAPSVPAAPAHIDQTVAPAISPDPCPPFRTPEPPRAEPGPAAKQQTVAPPEPPTTPAPRNIELKLNIEDGRVQVHVAERAGDVHIAVHTPDRNLAGTLRDDLPQLTSRLEQTGYHAETWHGPAQGPAESVSPSQTSAGSPYQDSADPRQHPSGGQPGDQSKQQQRPPAEEQAPKKSAQEFSWLLDSLR